MISSSSDCRIHGAVLGALVSDSLSLGSHYEYDAIKIKQAYGGKSIDTLLAPGERMGGSTHGVGWGQRNYHPGTFFCPCAFFPVLSSPFTHAPPHGIWLFADAKSPKPLLTRVCA